MKRNLFKKLAAAAGAAVMALTLVMPMGVNAEPTNDYPATDEKGSLTITKYESTTGAGVWDTSDGVQSPPSGDATPLGGVTFTILKVGTVSQETYTVDGEQVTGLVYNITDTELQTKLSSLTGGDKADPVTSGTNKYTSTVLDKALKALYESDQNVADGIVTRDAVKSEAKSQTTLTADSNDLKKGQAKFAELDQGLYLVAETAAPAEVTTKSVPFFVSIPSVVNDTNGNTQWTLDVNAYPKNSTEKTRIDKIISDVMDAANQKESGDINSYKDKAEATIGDTITYQVPVTAVVPADGLTKLNLADTMDKGLTLVKSDGTAIEPALTTSETTITGVVEVYEGENTTGTTLSEGTDYTVKAKKNDNGSTSLTVAFEDDKLNELNAAADKTPQFTFVYKAKLNVEAVIGQTGNKNSVKLIYDYNNNPSGDIESQPQETTVYTWGIDILKQGEDLQNLNGVEFELYNGSVADANKMKFAGSNGVYTPDNTSDSTTLETANGGKLQIRGLEAGTYILKEIKTNQGYVLLKDTITIKITDTDIAGEASATVANGTSAATSVTMKADNGSAQALVPLTVVNNKGFDLPQTGAAGTAIFAIAGIVLVAVAGALLIFRRKTQK